MLKNEAPHIPVIIIGGGPVGLFLGICLAQSGIKFRIFERRSATVNHSRSIGIHPVALDIFSQAGIETPFLKEGLHIQKGRAYVGREQAGIIDFSKLPRPHNFILSLPQYRTENLLESALAKNAPGTLQREAVYTKHAPDGDKIKVEVMEKGVKKQYICNFLIGCDGKQSKVRQQAGITYHGRRYPDTYLMCDMDDTTPFGRDAVVFLHREGVIESFPLPGRKRRWVVKTDHYIQDPARRLLDDLIQRRLGIDVYGAKHDLLNAFGVQHYIAGRFVYGNVILAGDAAHVVSPIGGQGMNLGWLDGWELSCNLKAIIREDKAKKALLKQYEKTQQSVVQKAGRRAAFNMMLGRSYSVVKIRRKLVKLITRPPLESLMRNLFAMQHLRDWPV